MIRQLLHAVFAVLMWVVFVYYWNLVVRRPMNPDTKTALIALAVLTAVTVVMLCIWIYHNIRVHRRFRGRRRARREAALPVRDYLGRRLMLGDADTLRRAGSIEVSVKSGWADGKYEEQKTFIPS
ncbi:MAG: hypothetical protein P8181_14020 [bacterium]